MEIKEKKEKFPWKIIDLDPESNSELLKHFRCEPTGFVRVGPKGYIYGHKFYEECDKIYNMKLYPSDIFVSGFPRSGTTWTQELVWMVSNDLDYQTSRSELLRNRTRVLELPLLFNQKLKDRLIERYSNDQERLKLLKKCSLPLSYEELEVIPPPRIFKTHLALTLLPPSLLDTAKMVYIARDPRDVAVSFYYLSKLMAFIDFQGDFKTFWSLFINDLVIWTPYFGGLKEAWNQRHHPNLLFMFYEDNVKDKPYAIRRVSEFLGKQFTETQIEQLSEHLSVENFKKSKTLNFEMMLDVGLFNRNQGHFIRKGKAGGWRDYFDAEMTLQAERWIADNLQDTDLRFPHMNDI